ncbi:YbdK family carboxylate-amine ligase [Agromyces mediolanus]|uniref:Putative glutamate--cysteine ligase 2 n=1 Tax=Agromyces mediolanus TaxID=41986 RepID=A0A918CAI1_AGRME|nr:YbdK family carboxylate-amine ligase [Agromyces mediolanus]GGR13926.1 putative glutamate--cysteine ligase 2 [Agromyces mediolanus]GLJ72714.1 putative glutamate--cysteine ligase 2 [Agromyces mediolanus]
MTGFDPAPTEASAWTAPPAPRLGIEEEFALVVPRTLEPANAAAAVRERLDEVSLPGSPRIEGEFLAHQLEYATPVCDDARAAAPLLLRARRELAAAAAGLGLGVASSGTLLHEADSPEPADGARYRRIAADIRGILDDHQVCGMHVHLGYDDPEQRVEALNRLRGWVPLLTALAANSPFWRGRDTGFASWRTILLRRWISIGVPAPFADFADYTGRRTQVLAAVGDDDAALVTWTVRLSHHLPTIELRFGDAQLEVRDTVAVCGFVRLIAARMMRMPQPPPAIDSDVLNTAVWTAARDGHAALVPHPLGEGVAPLPALVEWALDWCGSPGSVARDIRSLLARGSGAERQRRAYASGGLAALGATVAAHHGPLRTSGLAPAADGVKPDAAGAAVE